MHVKKHLGFTALRRQLSERLRQIDDNRQQSKVEYSLHDCFMSGFAMMHFQDPSLLEFQRHLEAEQQQNNLRTMFGVTAIPSDTQLRDVLDNTLAKDKLQLVFSDYFRQLQRSKQLEQLQFLPRTYLVTLDGSEYFSSEKIKCPQCLVTIPKKGNPRYHHQILQAAIVCPGIRQIIPIAAEAIQNTDGKDKQDCEINAGKRILKKIRQAHPKLKIIIVADSLYSKQPFIGLLRELGFSFILVAKPGDHKTMMEWVQEQQLLGEISHSEYKDAKDKQHIYNWVNDVPLNGNNETVWVNYIEYSQVVKGKVTYRNSWVTDIMVDINNKTKLVRGGRARWKIENEGFNTLKNQGYHLGHNFGHGKKNLSFNFFLLNMLAFLVHQILELTDLLYQRCRAKFSARKEYWNQLRCTIRIMIFPSWEELLRFIISPPG